MVPGLYLKYRPIKMSGDRMVAGLGIQIKKCNETSNLLKTVFENR